jgi:hypothetical protein
VLGEEGVVASAHREGVLVGWVGAGAVGHVKPLFFGRDAAAVLAGA